MGFAVIAEKTKPVLGEHGKQFDKTCINSVESSPFVSYDFAQLEAHETK
jgi:hypothetical protein